MQAHIYPVFATKLLALLIGIYNNKYFPFAYRLFVLHVFTALFTEVLGLYLISIKYSNVLLFNVFNLLEVWLLTLAAASLVSHGYIKKTLYSFLILISFYWVYNVIYLSNRQYFNWHLVTYSVFFIVIYIVVLFDNSLFRQKHLLRQPLFLICLSVILYCGSSIPLFGTLNFLVETDMKTAAKLFYISHVMNILRYSLVALAFYLYGRQAKRGYAGQ